MATARATFGRGMLLVSTETADDRQQFIEHILGCLHRWGQVEVRVDQVSWVVKRPCAEVPRCNLCGEDMDRAVCRRTSRSTSACCIVCALARASLTAPMLRQLPPETILCDVTAHAAHGNEWTAWMRWPQATASEILDEMHLQRRFAPVLRFVCAEIRLSEATPLAKGIARSARSMRGARHV